MKKYVIVDNPPTDEQIAESIELRETLRASLDGSKCVLKFQGDTPPAFVGETILEHAEAFALMQTEAWQENAIPNEPGTEPVQLEDMTRAELKDLAKSMGLKVSLLTTKAKLVAAIEAESVDE
mgnify:CR=1 FL=1